VARGLRPQAPSGDGRPAVGPDPLDEHGAPRVASVPFMVTLEMKRGLRALGYSDEQITHLRPQQAHEILANPIPNPRSKDDDHSRSQSADRP
jgi:hypothetical protein